MRFFTNLVEPSLRNQKIPRSLVGKHWYYIQFNCQSDVYPFRAYETPNNQPGIKLLGEKFLLPTD